MRTELSRIVNLGFFDQMKNKKNISSSLLKALLLSFEFSLIERVILTYFSFGKEIEEVYPIYQSIKKFMNK